MKIKNIIILHLFLCIVYSSSDNDIILSNMNNETKWSYQYTIDDIKVYKMNNDSIPIIKLTKQTESLNDIFEVILDINNYNQVISNKNFFTKRINIKIESDTLYGYQKISNLIPFIKNRQIIFKLFRVNDNRLDWKLLNSNDILFDEYNDNYNKVLSYGAGSWQIEENKLIHYYYIDPELKLPDFLINKAAERSVMDIFKDVLYFNQSN